MVCLHTRYNCLGTSCTCVSYDNGRNIIYLFFFADRKYQQLMTWFECRKRNDILRAFLGHEPSSILSSKNQGTKKVGMGFVLFALADLNRRWLFVFGFFNLVCFSCLLFGALWVRGAMGASSMILYSHIHWVVFKLEGLSVSGNCMCVCVCACGL